MPSLPPGLNGGYYGALPGVPVQPAHSSAPVGLIPGGPMGSLVGAPGSVSAAPAPAEAGLELVSKML